MNNSNLNIAGKNAGEITRDIADFLSQSCIMHARQEMDLARLLPDLNMKEQFSFAFLMEALVQGWTPEAAENFYLRSCAPLVGNQIAGEIIEAFHHPSGAAFQQYKEKYGCDFGLTSRSYWTSCLAIAVDANALSQLMDYLRAFTFTLMEFAFMDNRNPDKTYAWEYYQSFQKILTELQTPPVDPNPVKVCSLGGCVGAKSTDGYVLALGIDLQNPNSRHIAQNTKIDITLKDKNGQIITVIEDQINRIDQNSVFHYGITRKIKGNAVAHISAKASCTDFHEEMSRSVKALKIVKASYSKPDGKAILKGILVNQSQLTVRSFALHYQFLSEENKILGGGCEWFFEEFAPGTEKDFTAICPVLFPKAKRIVYSTDFQIKDTLS